MEDERVVVILNLHKRHKKYDVDIPLDITANELVEAINQAFVLNIDMDDITQCFLRTENPIALLKGNKTLRDFKIRNGTVINIID